MAILEIQHLKLQGILVPGLDPIVAPAHAFAAEVQLLLGLDLCFSDEDKHLMDVNLQRRLSQKRYRESAQGREVRKEWRRKSYKSQAEQRKQGTGPGKYVPGGSRAAAAAVDPKLLALQEAEWCGDGGLVVLEEATLKGAVNKIVDLHFEEAFASEMLDPNGDEGVDTVDDENDGY